jgi:hypothetical protein
MIRASPRRRAWTTKGDRHVRRTERARAAGERRSLPTFIFLARSDSTMGCGHSAAGSDPRFVRACDAIIQHKPGWRCSRQDIDDVKGIVSGRYLTKFELTKLRGAYAVWHRHEPDAISDHRFIEACDRVLECRCEDMQAIFDVMATMGSLTALEQSKLRSALTRWYDQEKTPARDRFRWPILKAQLIEGARRPEKS